jgi:hypothetical protein
MQHCVHGDASQATEGGFLLSAHRALVKEKSRIARQVLSGDTAQNTEDAGTNSSVTRVSSDE